MIDAERPADWVRQFHDEMMRILGWGVAHGWIRRTRDPLRRIAAPVRPNPSTSGAAGPTR
jgi:hypothetical protein